MKDLIPSGRVRELQAMLFPVQPIPSGTLASFRGPSPDLQTSQLDRYEIERRSEEPSLFAIPLSLARHRSETREALRALIDARCVVEGIAHESARWPTECQVTSERVRHIDYNPTNPEPFYTPTGKEPKPRPVCDELGSIIFRYCPTNITNYFSRSCVGGSPILPFSNEFIDNERSLPCMTLGPKATQSDHVILLDEEGLTTNDEDSDLRFESRFESGNLGKVVKITDTYYQLYLRRDLYTQRHTQWYYFRISNTRSRIIYRLSIVNLCKEESLYNEGLRPLLYSMEDARTRAIGWRRCGDNITYYKNSDSSDDDKERHTLTFNISFPYDRDTVYLAHCYPYTYTDLQEYLAKIAVDPIKTRFTKLRLLCRTLAGNSVYYLTITAPTYENEVRRKRGVVVTARVHPGETPSSWTMKGMIDFLTGDSSQAKELRERFVFKLVPMLNPDGVIVGNNRCSLSGKDLNRQYKTVMRESYPSVWHTKLMVRRLLEECGVAIYCDLHAHSRKHNIFAYGCENKRTGCCARLSEQVFPLMLHKNAADKFSFENCKFHVEKGKEGTGRVVMWSMGVMNSYTVEASMGGSKLGSRSGTHFSAQDYEQIGKVFCETLLDFSDQDPLKERLRTKIIARLTKEGSSADEPTNIDLTDYSSDEGDTSEASSEEERIETMKDIWRYEKSIRPIDRNRYPSVPPPSPASIAECERIETNKRRIKKSTKTQRTYLERRRLLTRRAVMDLPTTDPGSDLYEMTDSADESFTIVRGKKQMDVSAAIRMRREDETIASAPEREDGTSADQKLESDHGRLILPEIVRPRSVSLGESLLEQENPRRTNERAHCLRLSRTFRNSPSLSKGASDVQIKLTSLRQQIWMGLPLCVDEERNADNHVRRAPLSWGISALALQYQTDSETLLMSCSRKLQSLDYPVGRDTESRKVRKKERKKGTREAETEPPTVTRNEEERKSTRKKRSRTKWQRAVNMNSRIKDGCNGKPSNSYLSVNADSMKLISLTETAPQPQTARTSRQRVPKKLESKRKFRVSGMAAVAANASGAKTNANRSQNVRGPTRLQTLGKPLARNSSSSEDLSNESNKWKGAKRKQRRKKQQRKSRVQTIGPGGKMRASSARIFRGSVALT